MKPFNLEAALSGAKVVTRDGREVTEIYLFKTSNSKAPVYAIINGAIHSYMKNGAYYLFQKSDHDLFMAPTKREGWVNIYPPIYSSSQFIAESSNIFPTQEIADERSQNGRTACVKIEWEE